MSISRRNFTFRKFIETGDVVEGTENEISPHGGRFVPWNLILTRDMSMGSFASGGALVGTEVRPELIPYLRAKSICGRLGATILDGIKMPNAFPIATSDFSGQWLSEFQGATAVDVALAQMLFSPHRLTASLNYSNLLVGQAAGDFEEQVRVQMIQKLRQALDAAALTSPVNGAAPLGLLGTNGTTQISFSGAPTWTKLMSFPQAVENSNADIEGASLGFACSPNSKFVWRTTQRNSGTSTFLCEGNKVGDYPVESTTELNAANAGDRCLFGNFRDLYLGIFASPGGQGGAWVTVDPFSKSTTGERTMTIHIYADCGTPRPQSFAVSVDSAAQ
jgi:hypothetical protein